MTKRKTKDNVRLFIAPSRESFLDKYCDKHYDKITYCYQKEWDNFVEVCKDFLKGRYTNDLKILLIDRIEPIPKDLENRFTAEEKQEYAQYLFRDAVCMDESKRKVGTLIECDLPVAFKIYIKKERYKKLSTGGLPQSFCIKDFNQMRDLCIKSITKKIKEKNFEIRAIDEGTVNNFEFFTVSLVQKRNYNMSEDMLIRGKRDPDMKIVVNYRPNKYFFGKNNKSMFALEGKEQSQEVVGTVFATLGVVFLGSLIGGVGYHYGNHKETVEKMKEASKYFSAEEVDTIDKYIDNLCRDIDYIEEHFVKYATNKKLEECITLYINDNIREMSMSQIKEDMKGNSIDDNLNFAIQLFFRMDVDESIYEYSSDGTNINGTTDNYEGVAKKVRDFANSKLKNEKFPRSKSKLIEIIDQGERAPSSLSVQIDKLLRIEPPKEIIKILEDVKGRIPKEQ